MAIDRQVLEELEHSVGDDAEFLRDLVGTYLEDAPTQLAHIRAALAQGDVERVNRAAHTLKSNSASMGAMRLAEMCRELESMTQPATTNAADLAVPEFATRADALAAELEVVQSELDSLVPASESV